MLATLFEQFVEQPLAFMAFIALLSLGLAVPCAFLSLAIGYVK